MKRTIFRCIPHALATILFLAYITLLVDQFGLIPGGVLPGVTVIQPGFPVTNNWPFLWYENEYVVDTATALILLANCANVVAQPEEKH